MQACALTQTVRTTPKDSARRATSSRSRTPWSSRYKTTSVVATRSKEVKHRFPTDHHPMVRFLLALLRLLRLRLRLDFRASHCKSLGRFFTLRESILREFKKRSESNKKIDSIVVRECCHQRSLFRIESCHWITETSNCNKDQLTKKLKYYNFLGSFGRLNLHHSF